MIERSFVVVVDDDASVRKALGRLLRTANMEVATYSSAQEFLVALEHREPDCLVLDIRMPGMTGLELRDRLATMGRRIPIVFITAHAGDAAVERDPSEERDGLLLKPFNDAALLAAIHRRVVPPETEPLN
jgi:FixJ family two-component response regulator